MEKNTGLLGCFQKCFLEAYLVKKNTIFNFHGVLKMWCSWSVMQLPEMSVWHMYLQKLKNSTLHRILGWYIWMSWLSLSFFHSQVPSVFVQISELLYKTSFFFSVWASSSNWSYFWINTVVTDINMHFAFVKGLLLWLNDGLVVACISNLSFHSIQGRCNGMNNKGLHCWSIRKTLCTKILKNMNIKWLLCTMYHSFLHFRREAASVGVQPEWRVEWSPFEEWPGLGTQ